jgi:Tol biopolymer transport system component
VQSVDFSTWNPVKWAADGRAVLYVSTQARTSNIWRLPIDGSAPKQLTGFKSEQITGFDLSPDGKQLACQRTFHFTDVALMTGIK